MYIAFSEATLHIRNGIELNVTAVKSETRKTWEWKTPHQIAGVENAS